MAKLDAKSVKNDGSIGGRMYVVRKIYKQMKGRKVKM